MISVIHIIAHRKAWPANISPSHQHISEAKYLCGCLSSDMAFMCRPISHVTPRDFSPCWPIVAGFNHYYDAWRFNASASQ